MSKKFTVLDALGHNQIVEASSIYAATSQINRTGERNLFCIDGGGKTRFYLDRGGATLWPISARAAQVELAMGGFEQ